MFSLRLTVKINRLAPEGVNIFVKLEAQNPLQSVKDRLALGVIEDAERRGVLKPGQTIVEATSGNTGIALAMVCAAKGYPFVAVMIETFSIERRKIMKFLGAKVVLTPKELKGTGMVAKAKELAEQNGWFETKQFANPANPEYHRQTTGPEIVSAFVGQKLDYIVSGWGTGKLVFSKLQCPKYSLSITFNTGGTLTGVSAFVRTARPGVKIVVAEPSKAPLLAGGSFTGHAIQGWAPDFIPEVLNREAYDELLPVTDEDAIATSKLLAQKEGIFVGISSGATFSAALAVAKKAPKGSHILVILPDTAERYLSTPLFADITAESDEINKAPVPAAAAVVSTRQTQPHQLPFAKLFSGSKSQTQIQVEVPQPVFHPRLPIHESVLTLIGNTPVVKINHLAPEGINLFVKIESFNPLSSVKDRLALGVIEDAERRGVLKPGQTVVEATSGNTGIALAFVCAAKGYPFVAVMAESFSIERRKIMKFLGAKVVLTPKEEKASGMVVKAAQLAKEHGWFETKQFSNPANPEFHKQTTGPEILKDFAGKKLDYIVMGWGTGGTLSGVSSVVRLARPEVKIVASEPTKAPLLAGGEFTGHAIQGWAPNFIPETLDRNSYDNLIAVTDEEAIANSKLLAKKEGIFVGISSGATFAAGLKIAEKAKPGSSILIILPDTAERYLSTPLFADITADGDIL
ncbi:hypothetical protein HK100_002427 [Physocladia obscura]|uniref:Tryptophan synthase beta chain-like PALP domain-containing protein n=1 Tax=Physocladia obscura TaxID=109957 RepID=A0AAD5SVE6_9FUNG|nr:hypothetical protein HK100_002427 [Physocladia obscura]